MSTYPGGGTSPTSFTPITSIAEHPVHHAAGFPVTGGELGVVVVVAVLLALFGAFCVRGVRLFGRSEHKR